MDAVIIRTVIMEKQMATKTTRYKSNPFIENMIIPVGSKSVTISALGKDDNILVNQKTGEIHGTHVVARKRVDADKFIKTFADYMAYTFDLTRAGNKTLRVVMWAMQEHAVGRDTVMLDRYTHEAFLTAHGFSGSESSDKIPALSYPTFTRGLAELERSKIIAKTIRAGTYFINPSCMFNGDRVAFTTIIERGTEQQMGLELV